MFSEFSDISQIEGEPKRRWFADKNLELIVWLDEDDKIVGFQFCYETDKESRAVTWLENTGYSHARIDEGEDRLPHHKATPILIPDRVFDKKIVEERFASSSDGIPKEIARFVSKKLSEYKANA